MGAATSVTVADPAPDPTPETAIQPGKARTAHEQEAAVWMLTVRLPPAKGACKVVGETVYVHGGPDGVTKWVEYSKAKDQMFKYTDIKEAPWWVVDADNKKSARLNCIHHLLSQIPYRALPLPPVKLPRRQSDTGYVRPPINSQTFVPSVY